MGEIFSQLERLFIQAVPTVVFIFLLFIILDRIFFRPLISLLMRREESTVGALARAREQAAAAESKTREYEETFQAARQEVYRQRETERHATMGERDATLVKAREQAEVLMRDAQAQLAAEVGRAKVEIEAACRPLAEQISERLVGPEPTAGGGGSRL